MFLFNWFRQEGEGQAPARSSSQDLHTAQQDEDGEEDPLAAHVEDEELQMALALSQSVDEASAAQALREQESIAAAERQSLGPTGSNSKAEAVSYSLWSRDCLQYNEHVCHGVFDRRGTFSSAVGADETFLPLEQLCCIQPDPQDDGEVILVDQEQDPGYQAVDERATAAIAANVQHGPEACVQALARLVADKLGGRCSFAECAVLWAAAAACLKAQRNSVVLPLGALPVGLARHRALLFKALADANDLPCQLLRGPSYLGEAGLSGEAAIVMVRVNGRELMVDLMANPGTTYPANPASTAAFAHGPGSPSALPAADTRPALAQPIRARPYPRSVSAASSGQADPGLDGLSDKDDMNSPALVDPLVQDPEPWSRECAGSAVYRLRPQSAANAVPFPHSHAQQEPKASTTGREADGLAGSLEQCRLSGEGAQPGRAAHDNGAEPLGDGVQESWVNCGMAAASPFESAEAQTGSDWDNRPRDFEALPAIPEQPTSSSPSEGPPGRPSEGASGRPGLLEASSSVLSREQTLTDGSTGGTHIHGPVQAGRGANSAFYAFGSPGGEPAASSEGPGGIPGGIPITQAVNGLHRPWRRRHSASEAVGSWSTDPEDEPWHQQRMTQQEEAVQPLHRPPGSEVKALEPLRNAPPRGWIPPAFPGYPALGPRSPSWDPLGGIAGLANGHSEQAGHATQLTDVALLPNGQSAQAVVQEQPQDEWEVDYQDIERGRRIGIGSFGEVFHCTWQMTDVAVKRLLDQDLCDQRMADFRAEVAIMKRLKHPNIVLFMGACTKPPDLCILTQYAPRGSLFTLLHRTPGSHQQLDERRRWRMGLDVCRGMHYLHSCRPPIVHRDLKSPNLLVDKDFTIKVCDFGLSQVRQSTWMTNHNQAGSPSWTAPEVLTNQHYNEKSDIWSMGVILWELCMLQEPWSGLTPMQVVGVVGWQRRTLPLPEPEDHPLQDLIRRCWLDPGERPSFVEIGNHLMKLAQPPMTGRPVA